MRIDHVIRLTVEAPYGGERWEMAVQANEFPIFGERLAGEMELGVSNLSFDQAVTVLRQREFRREILLSAAKRLAIRMADYIEDLEGWNGERRQESTKASKSLQNIKSSDGNGV